MSGQQVFEQSRPQFYGIPVRAELAAIKACKNAAVQSGTKRRPRQFFLASTCVRPREHDKLPVWPGDA